jgi:hypothetical protein
VIDPEEFDGGGRSDFLIGLGRGKGRGHEEKGKKLKMKNEEKGAPSNPLFHFT